VANKILALARNGPLARIRIDVRNRAEQPPQSSRVVVHPYCADPRQGHRARVTPTHPDAVGVVAQPEAIPAAALPLLPGKADPPASTLAGLRVLVGGECAAQVDRGLLEHLRGDPVPPSQSGHLLGGSAILGDDEDAPGGLAALPGIECVDQSKP
jgi:hypothetical protein